MAFDVIVRRKEKKRKSGKEVGKGSGKSDKTEESIKSNEAVDQPIWRKATENR